MDELILTHGLAEETAFHEAFHLSRDQNRENDWHFSVNVRQMKRRHKTRTWKDTPKLTNKTKYFIALHQPSSKALVLHPVFAK